MKISRKKFDIARGNKGLSIKELSKMTGLSQATLLKVGKQELNPVTVGKIAKALNVTIEEIIEDSDQASK